MSRSTLIVVLAVLGSLVAVVAGSVRLARRDLAALERQFEAERRQQVDDAASAIGVELNDIGEDLRVAAQLVQASASTAERERALSALLAVVKQYNAVQVFDRDGNRTLSVSDQRGTRRLADPRYPEALVATARRALGRGFGEVLTSPPIAADADGWTRAFATALPPPRPGQPGGAVAILVNTEPSFERLRLLAPGLSARVLLLGPHGRPMPATDAQLAALTETQLPDPQLPGYAALLERMRRGERGSLRLGAFEAERLGLGDAPAVVAYAPIELTGGGSLSVATLTSVAVLRSEERANSTRLLLTSGAIALLLLTFGTYLVITSRRAAITRERLKTAEHLAHLHEKTEKILDNVPTGVLALSDAGRISSVNRALRERMPSPVEGLLLAQAFPHAEAKVVAQLEALVESARRTGHLSSLRGATLSLFGEEGQYSLHAIPLAPRFPEARLLLVFEDLSEVRSLASQLLRAEKLATVGIISAGIAHEIGTPLSVVRARAEYLLGKLGAEHTGAPGLKVIVEQIDLVTRTIRQLLDFSRKKSVAVRAVEVHQSARTVAELLRFEAQRRNVAIEVAVPAALPCVAADPDALQQALVNLVMNSLDACARGGRVEISGHFEPGQPAGSEQVRIDVVDTGCGISEEHRLQVFDPFFTTKKRGQGTGLGLTMVAQIVRSHGGLVELDSKPGAGTRVSMQWPAARAGEELLDVR